MTNGPGWVGVAVKVGDPVGVRVDVLVGVAVNVEVAVFVGVCEGVTEAVGVPVNVAVAVLVGVCEGVAEAVGVPVKVGVRVGPPVSTVQVRLAGVPSIFPARSVAITWNVCEPSKRLSKVCGEAHPSISSPSRSHRNEAPDSFDEKVKVAEVLLTIPLGPELMTVSGAVLSTITVLPVEVVALDPRSTARAVIVTGPSTLEVEFQMTL